MERLILECVVRSALLPAFIAIALLVLRVRAARVRHAVWSSVVVLMLIMPAWTVWGPKAVLRVFKPQPVIVAAQPIVAQQQVASVADLPAASVPTPRWTWEDSLIALYFLGFTALMSRLLIGTVRTRMLVRRAGNRSGRLTSDYCVTPITVGWLRPSVILPAGWLMWSGAQLNAVLAHEEEHVRRRDPLVQWLALLNRAVFWFHPVAWWLERRLSGLAEEACDDAVLMRGHDPLQYSEYLLGLARVVQESGARVAVVGMAMPGTFLPARIRRLVKGADMQRISHGRLISVGAVCMVVSAVFTAGALGYSVPEMQLASRQEPSVSPSPVASEHLAAQSDSGTKASVWKKILLAQAATQPAAVPSAPSPAATGQSLTGVVTDPSGAVVPNAQVALKGENSAAISLTDALGRFELQNIDAGEYSLTVTAPGFKVITRTNLRISAGDAHDIGNMPLPLGSMSESMNVTGSRSAPVATATPVGNPLGPMTSLAPATAPPVGIPLDQKLPRSFPSSANGGQRPTKVGGMVQPANLVKPIRPVYPPDLQQQGVQGTVRMEAVVLKDGRVNELTSIGSPDPGLTRAAMEAVWQWRYTPTMLNGEPVETLTVIDVNFSLKD